MLHRYRRGLFSTYNSGLVAFFTIGVVLSIIIINVGFMVMDAQKQVVTETLDEVDDYLMVAGRISNTIDNSSSELTATAIPVKTASSGSINLDPQILNVTFQLTKLPYNVIRYDNIFVGSLPNHTFNSVTDAVTVANQKGLIETNPYVGNQKPTSTSGFFYWITNQNFDQRIDPDELAALAIVYAEMDRPSTGDKLQIHVNSTDGIVLKLEREIPNVSGTAMSFGGKIREP